MGLLEMFDPEVVQAMKGFGPSDEDKQKAMNMGLLHAGLGILAGNRGYGKGQALSNAVGAGGIHGLNAYQQQLNDVERDQMRQLQTAQMAQGMVQKQRQQQALQNAPEHVRQAVSMGVPIADIWKSENQAYNLSPGDVRMRGNEVIAKGAPKVPEWGMLGPDGEVQVNPMYLDMKRQIAAAGRPNIETKIINAAETEQAKAWGKNLGELRSDITKSAFNAPSQLAKLQRMEELLAGVEGGKLAPLGLEVASAAKSLGINIDPKLGNKEAAEALSREIAGGFRQPGTGPMTDKDFENFLKRVPDLSKTAEGRKEIFKTMRATYNRDIAAGKLVKDYAKKKGGNIDDDFIDELAGMYAQNPVVAPQPQGVGFKIIGVR